MVWNHYAQRNEPSSKIKDMKPHITDNLQHAVRSFETMDPTDKQSIIQLQQASGNAYHNQVKSELDRRSMMVVEQDFKKWLAGQLEGANFNNDTSKVSPGNYERKCKVMNIRDPSRGKHFMDPYTLVERNHTNWGTKDLMSLPGVADYLKENDRQEMDGKMHDALLHDPSTGRLKDLESAWEYFCKFVVQQPDMFSKDIDFVDADFPGDSRGNFHPGNWGSNDHMRPLIPPSHGSVRSRRSEFDVIDRRGTTFGPKNVPLVRGPHSKYNGPFGKMAKAKPDFNYQDPDKPPPTPNRVQEGYSTERMEAMMREVEKKSFIEGQDLGRREQSYEDFDGTRTDAAVANHEALLRQANLEIANLEAQRAEGRFDATDYSVAVVGPPNVRSAGVVDVSGMSPATKRLQATLENQNRDSRDNLIKTLFGVAGEAQS